MDITEYVNYLWMLWNYGHLLWQFSDSVMSICFISLWNLLMDITECVSNDLTKKKHKLQRWHSSYPHYIYIYLYYYIHILIVLKHGYISICICHMWIVLLICANDVSTSNDGIFYDILSFGRIHDMILKLDDEIWYGLSRCPVGMIAGMIW